MECSSYYMKEHIKNREQRWKDSSPIWKKGMVYSAVQGIFAGADEIAHPDKYKETPETLELVKEDIRRIKEDILEVYRRLDLKNGSPEKKKGYIKFAPLFLTDYLIKDYALAVDEFMAEPTEDSFKKIGELGLKIVRANQI